MTTPHPTPSRREFLKTSTVAAVTGALASSFNLRSVHAAGDDIIKLGLVGCGGRGSGAAVNALMADPQTKLVAMGDAFSDRLEGSLVNLKKQQGVGERVDVSPERRHVGMDAYKRVIENADVVLLCTPPHFRPAQLKACIEAGKHVFAEKPVAVDAPGIRDVLETCKLAKEKGLSVVSGLCYRYDYAKRETIQKVQEGVIGDITALQCTYNTGTLWKWDRKEGWSDMEYQLRNWLYYTWLSGDHNVEQHVHSLDKIAWVMKDEPPISAIGVGGRQQRTEAIYGNIFDHHSVTYEYANGVKLFAQTRQMDGCQNDVTDFVYGTKGTAALMTHQITGENAWRFRGQKNNMYQTEHEELFQSIRNGKPINNGEYMAKSSMMAIMGRMATYTGGKITWEQAMNSQEKLGPDTYAFGPLEYPPVAIPGRTRFA